MDIIVINNRKLAKFMGGENLAKDRPDMFCFEQNPVNHKWLSDSELQYDTDWKKLMQVVEQIELLEYKVTIGGRTSKNYCDIRGEADDYDTKYADSYGKTKIEAVYNACVEFIDCIQQTK